MPATNPTRHEFQQDDIHALAQQVQRHVTERWRATLEENDEKLADAYARGGDMAYGTYLGLLFQPLNRQLRAAGFTLTPDLPGNMDRSREWGEAADGTDQQRWMWSLVRRRGGEKLGALVTVVFHDHTAFKLPRAPGLVALSETNDEAVIAALSARSSEFGSAREFTAEVAEYMRNLEDDGAS